MLQVERYNKSATVFHVYNRVMYRYSSVMNDNNRLVGRASINISLKTSITVDYSCEHRRSTYRQLNETCCEIGFKFGFMAALKTNPCQRQRPKQKIRRPTSCETMSHKHRHCCDCRTLSVTVGSPVDIMRLIRSKRCD